MVKYEYDEEPYLLYNFTLRKGDEFTSHLYDTSPFITRIDSVKYEYIGGKVRKVFITSPLIVLDLGYDQGYFGDNGKIVEGINSVKSFMFGNYYEQDFYYHDSLRCLSYYNDKGIKVLKKFVNYPCDTLTVGTNEISINPIEIYPNPASEYITINFKNEFTGLIEIYSNLGEKVLSKPLFYKYQITLDINLIKNGSYFIKILNKKVNYINKIVKFKH
jgi:hypothetical protein